MGRLPGTLRTTLYTLGQWWLRAKAVEFLAGSGPVAAGGARRRRLGSRGSVVAAVSLGLAGLPKLPPGGGSRRHLGLPLLGNFQSELPRSYPIIFAVTRHSVKVRQYIYIYIYI